jgi:hypothetical protein
MAADTRKLAEGLATEMNRLQLLAVAESYDRLAEEAEATKNALQQPDGSD